MSDHVVPVLPVKTGRQLKAALHIKNHYADGEPLRGRDYRLLHGMLRRHPRAEEKTGPGVAAIVVHSYVGGTRCYFVIRTNGTAEDFSIYKCVGRETRASARIVAMMRSFRYARVLESFAKVAA